MLVCAPQCHRSIPACTVLLLPSKWKQCRAAQCSCCSHRPSPCRGSSACPWGELQAAAQEEGAAGKLQAPPVALCEGTARLSFRPSPPVLCTERAVRITKTYHDIDAVTNLLDEVSWCTGTWGCGTGTRGDNPG